MNLNKELENYEKPLKKNLKKQYNNINKNLEENKQKKIKLLRENRIEPVSWVNPNQKIFPQWINQTFSKYRLDKSNKFVISKEFQPFKYQEFLRDYLQENSPYRGVLLFHGLGSAKHVQLLQWLKILKMIVILL